MGQDQSKLFPHLTKAFEKTSVDDIDNSFDKTFQELKQLQPVEQTQRIMHVQLELTSAMSYLLLLQSTLQTEDAKLRKQLQQVKGQVLQQFHQAQDQETVQDDQQIQQIHHVQQQQLNLHKAVLSQTKEVKKSKPKQPKMQPQGTPGALGPQEVVPTLISKPLDINYYNKHQLD